MAHAIPKIYYNVLNKTGNTAGGSDFIASIVTTGLSLGMYVEGSGVQADSYIIAIGSGVQISKPITSGGSGVALTFFKRIIFDFPPVETTGEKLRPQERRSVSLSGLTQVSIDHVEAQRSLLFSFLSQSLFTELETFFKIWAVYGETFRYYDDKTLTTYTDVELLKFDWSPVKITPKSGGYVWRVPLEIRRVI